MCVHIAEKSFFFSDATGSLAITKKRFLHVARLTAGTVGLYVVLLGIVNAFVATEQRLKETTADYQISNMCRKEEEKGNSLIQITSSAHAEFPPIFYYYLSMAHSFAILSIRTCGSLCSSYYVCPHLFCPPFLPPHFCIHISLSFPCLSRFCATQKSSHPS